MSKNVLITGATSGIGEATARAFAKEGENLILTGRRVERLQKLLKEELQATYPNQKVWTFALDVTDMAMVKDVCQAILKSVGQVHVLVNNAGLALGLTAYQDYEEWDHADHARHQCQGLDDGDTSDLAKHGCCQ